MGRAVGCSVLLLASILVGSPLLAYDGPVQKQVFSMSSYTTVGGQAIKNVRVGYETYGALSPAKVNVQKALLDSLGITRLHAVMGASMGALQSFEWASAFPAMVDRIVPVIGAAELDDYGIGWMNVWGAPILLDPRWNNGDYYGKSE